MYPCSCFVKADVEDEYKKIAVETDAGGCILLWSKCVLTQQCGRSLHNATSRNCATGSGMNFGD